MPTALIIDLSYFVFYRFYATKQWYIRAYPHDGNVPDSYDWSLNQVFWDKFGKLWKDQIKMLVTKLESDRLFLAKDSSRSTLWRKVFYPEYKSNRDSAKPMGTIFERVYAELVPWTIETYSATVCHVPQCEADDVIYFLVKTYHSFFLNLVVLSSDHDLFQLKEPFPHVVLVNAKTDAYDQKALPCKQDNVYKKCILGDQSDNIGKSIPQVGDKGVVRLLQDSAELLQRFHAHSDSFELFCRNKCLVDFDHIPLEFYDYFLRQYGPGQI